MDTKKIEMEDKVSTKRDSTPWPHGLESVQRLPFKFQLYSSNIIKFVDFKIAEEKEDEDVTNEINKFWIYISRSNIKLELFTSDAQAKFQRSSFFRGGRKYLSSLIMEEVALPSK